MDNCIFCMIVNGDIPSTKLYEDEDFIVIMDIGPANKGHAILIAKEHAANLFEMKEETLAKVLPVVKKVGGAIMKTLGCDGMNILQNNGKASGQTVFHYHMHMIPRYDNDTVNVNWPTQSYADGEAAELAKKIISNM